MGRTLEGLPPTVLAELREALSEFDLGRATWVHGAFHFVGLDVDGRALRVRVGGAHRDAIAAEAEAMRWFSALGCSFRVPRVEIEPVHGDEWSAFACTMLPGAAMTARTWDDDRHVLMPLLEELAAVASTEPAPRPERAWCGGEAWPSIVASVTSGFAHELRSAALETVNVVVRGATDAHSPVHGDFGPHNILLGGDGVALIDPDNASTGESATDLAPLLGFYTPAALARDIPPRALARATAIRRSLPLQVAAAAELADDPTLRDHALGNFVRRESERR